MRCYLIAVCRLSSFDADTKNASLYQLAQDLNIHAAALGQVVPLELHTYFEVSPEEQGGKFSIRSVWIGSDGEVASVGTENPLALPPDARMMRVKSQALQLPTAFGNYYLSMQYRPAGAEAWTQDVSRWPIQVVEVVAPSLPAEAPATDPD